MFTELTNFGYERTGKQAVGFYLAYLLMAILIGALLGGLVGAFTELEDMSVAARVGAAGAFIIVLVLGGLIIQAKGLQGSLAAIMLVLLAGILTLFAGALGGLLPIAYLSTVKSKRADTANPADDVQDF